MKRFTRHRQSGNALLLALGTIFMVSLIGANVLMNCTTRYNVSSSQVRAWKDALYAAESGGDIAYAEVRKSILDPTNAFTGWALSGSTHSAPTTTLGQNSLTTSSTVERFYYDPSGNPWYRIRTKGTAPVMGMRRVGMDDRMNGTTRGDSLLRKIDFNYDHFTAAYGPNGDGAGKALVAVPRPQITRRLEQIAGPVTPFEAAIKASGTFYGLGSAAMVDSFNSKYGAYYFAANSPSDPHYNEARSGHVEIGSGTATVMGTIYGNVATNGGTVVRSSYVTGTIDNNVPFTLPPYKMPSLPAPQASPTFVGATMSITPPAPGTAQTPTTYLLSSWTNKLTINSVAGADTYVAIHLTGDMTGGVDVKANVHVQIYFDGNINFKARDMGNVSNNAANLQFYGISPTDPTKTQTVNIDPPGNFAATFYAPSANFSMNGNPDVIGAIVCHNFYANGNTSWHYDRALDNLGDAVDYRIASYVEDVR